MPLRATALPLLALSTLAGWTLVHLELKSSFPAADQALESPPAEIWLEYSVVPDMERSSFSVRGPAGIVALDSIRAGEKPEVLKAAVKGPMPAGAYTVSWVGAPMGDHAVRGRFTFRVGGDTERRGPLRRARRR